VNYFPEMSPSLENFVNTILTMKKFWIIEKKSELKKWERLRKLFEK
jgi:hypothetical protein